MAFPENLFQVHLSRFNDSQLPLAVCPRRHSYPLRPSRFAPVDFRTELHCHGPNCESDWIRRSRAGAKVAQGFW